MYILLKTFEAWQISEGLDPVRFFRELHRLCRPGDILGVGAYNPGMRAREWMTSRALSLAPPEQPFWDGNFELNRREYPLGRSYAIAFGEEQASGLARLAEEKEGSLDKPLFFDHLVAYRPGDPVLPLWDFHDAFMGGALHLSGHYSVETVDGFTRALGIEARRIISPELQLPDNLFPRPDNRK